MDQQALSTRNVLGMYYRRLETPLPTFVDGISNLFTSDQASETYPFLGQVPRYREWIGGRQVRGLRANQFTIRNRHYENTLGIAISDLRRDKTGQIRARVNEFADEGDAHWMTLLTTLIDTGISTACYDGQFFFDTDHSEGDSGSQSNDITVDISALPASVHGVVTAPSVEEMQQSIVAGIAQILRIKDDRGRPMNTRARKFIVTVPVGLWIPATAAMKALATSALLNQQLPQLAAGIDVGVEMLPELSWTDAFAVFRADANIKPLIRQEETKPMLKVQDENSAHAFNNDEIQLGEDAWRAADYGQWQGACYVQMT